MEPAREPAPLDVSSRELFLGFLEIAARSFGGAAAWTRFVLVDRRRWLSDEEFTEAWGIAQLVPGPNVVNLAVHLGDRARGARGAMAAFTGILVVPTLFVLAVDAVLMHWIHVPILRLALSGLGAAAAGLVFAMGLRMGARFRRDAIPLAIATATFLLAGPLRAPLPLVVLAMAPPGLLHAWRRAR